MKKIIFSLFASIALILGSIQPAQAGYPKHLQTLNLSSSSPYSYEDALSRLARTQPDGYVIESIRYVRMDGKFVVLIKLRKVG